MRKFAPLFVTPAIFLTAATLSGCAGEPAKPAREKILSGDQMLRDSQGIAQLGSRWQEGKQMVERAEIIQRDAQGKLEEARRMMEEGQKIMRESEEGYKNLKQ
ncbi:hypothetical protein ACQE3E_20060 [Methylomonas sp. MED-D]|uniref:hypothetical protein n=1 Tax=unclassified Methylomonas TaxID=2608980 RepID=UPI0028A56BAA|nr:hypothetical protein [Methylomonas sp. MV1]MDT4332259.1 hypothetical protein [Methylomonas sp. MV1]